MQNIFSFFWVLLLIFFLFLPSCNCTDSVIYVPPQCSECPDRCLKTGSSFQCVDCLNDQQCRNGNTDSTKLCNAKNRCICGSNKDCSTGKLCDAEKGCVECISNKDCTSPNKPVCYGSSCLHCIPKEKRACAPDGLDVCTQGTQQCTGDKWTECKDYAQCSQEEMCIEHQCWKDCPPTPVCKDGETRCVIEGENKGIAFQVCIQNSKGCFLWSQERKCSSNETCQKNVCTPTDCKEPECILNTARCEDNKTLQRCEKTASGCVAWSAKISCENNAICNDQTKTCAICEPGISRPCFSGNPAHSGVGVCKSGEQRCKEDGTSWSSCANEILPSIEYCNGKDDDCDGQVDEDFADKGKECMVGVGSCANKGLWVCSADGLKVECNAKPLAPSVEICNGKDDDCDGQVDEDFADKGKECMVGVGSCANKGLGACSADGLKVACDAKPLAPSVEICNGKDDDCDGIIDNAPNLSSLLTQSCYEGPSGTLGVGTCVAGTQQCTQGSWGVCIGQVLPTQEICNKKDDNCDGKVDEDFDKDKDGFFDSADSSCRIHYTTSELDCDDNEKEIHPNATEICNDKDDNCNGKIDDHTDGIHSVCNVCGDKKLGINEECDDGNKKDADGCSFDCKWEKGTEKNPAKTCLEILQAGHSQGDGIYWLKPLNVSFQARCDMTSPYVVSGDTFGRTNPFSGGWTLVARELANEKGNLTFLDKTTTNFEELAKGSQSGIIGYHFRSLYTHIMIQWGSNSLKFPLNGGCHFFDNASYFTGCNLGDVISYPSGTAADFSFRKYSGGYHCVINRFSPDSYRYEGTSWSVSPHQTSNRQFTVCGCSGTSWEGAGFYYGGVDSNPSFRAEHSGLTCPISGKTGTLGGWSGYKTSGEVKGGITSSDEITIWIR